MTVDLARGIASRLGVPCELRCVAAVRKSFDLVVSGAADLCFLAIDPRRAEQLAFTTAYLVIEGVYVVAQNSPLRTPADVDREGVRVGVKEGSAHDLHLSRELGHAQVVRGAEGTSVFLEQGLEAGAGIREPVTELVADRDDLRVIDEALMQIRQAVGAPRGRSQEAIDWLEASVAALVEPGIVVGEPII